MKGRLEKLRSDVQLSKEQWIAAVAEAERVRRGSC